MLPLVRTLMLLSAIVAIATPAAATTLPERPNVIVLLADAMGGDALDVGQDLLAGDEVQEVTRTVESCRVRPLPS